MLRLDTSAFERTARNLGLAEKEMPFALANALTHSAFKTKDALVNHTWPSAVKVKNSRFLRASLNVDPAMARDFRAGRSMSAAIFDNLGHVDLRRLEAGGTKAPTKGGLLAIPTTRVKRGAGGAVRAGQKPRALDPKKVVKKGNLLFMREGRGKNAKLRLMYKLRPNAKIKPTVPFHSDFDRLMRAQIYKSFPTSVRNVLKRNRLAGG
ncbi:MAG: hypothetical protein INR70_29985 [Parafilimonas terrae]|nr:hypothetical protein [Parafilimonas terrae]